MRGGIGLFERVDGARLFQRQADVVEAVQHAVAAEGVEFEGDLAAVRAGDFLVFQVDRQDGVGAARASSRSLSRSSGETTTGRMPFLKQLL